MALNKVTVTLDGVDYEAEFLWDDATSSGTAEITLTVPDETSWHLPGHYYPISVKLDATGGYMGKGEEMSTSYSADDTEALRLVVKERQPPVIDLVYPADGYYLTVRDRTIKFYLLDEVGGSSIDYSTLRVVIGDTDITALITAYPCDNGYYCIGTLPDRPMGDYEVQITVSDFDGNETAISFGYKYLVLITDRTQADVDYAKSLSWTADTKGAYNASDLNRVEMAVEYMSRRLGAYNFHPITKTDWTIPDIPTINDMMRYLRNVTTIRDTLPTHSHLPDTMVGLDYTGANEIEQAIIDTDNLLNDIAVQYFYSGEIYGGDI